MDKWLRNPNVVRLIALGLGILLWAVVSMDQNGIQKTNSSNQLRSEEIDNVSIVQEGLDEDLYFVRSVTPSQVTVGLLGMPNVLKQVNTVDAKVVLDLSSVKTGTQQIALQHEGFPNGVFVEISPSKVEVVVERMQKIEMPVTIDLTGKPQEGLQAGDPIIVPNKVHVSVPQTQEEEVAVVKAVIDITDAAETVKKQARLEVFNKAGEKITEAKVNPSVVSVEVPITNPFTIVPVQIRLVGEPANGYSVASVSQSVDEVRLFGPQSVLDEINIYDLLQVDVSGISANKKLTMSLPLIDGLTDIEPKSIEIEIDITPSETKAIENIPVMLNGLNTDYSASIVGSDSRINLLLEGAPVVLDSIQANDIVASADLSRLRPGQHVVAITLSLPRYVKQLGNKPTITVEISETRND